MMTMTWVAGLVTEISGVLLCRYQTVSCSISELPGTRVAMTEILGYSWALVSNCQQVEASACHLGGGFSGLLLGCSCI